MVDGYVFEKYHIYALSCVNASIWSWHVLVALLCLICGWIASLLIIWGQRLICHHECLALLLYLMEGHKFLFVAKTFHVPFTNLKMKWKLLGNVLPCHMCWISFALGAKPLLDAYQWEVSYIEVGTCTTRNQPFANTYIWLQYGCFGCIWNQLHRSEVVDTWLQLERCNSLR
jgi:hypothetical protein